MRRLATMGALTLLAAIGALSPLPALADIVQPVHDTLTTDPPTLNGGWSETLGTGISGTLTQAVFNLRFNRSAYYGPAFSFSLAACSDAQYTQCQTVYGLGPNYVAQSPQGAVGVDTDITLTFTSPDGFTFDPNTYYIITPQINFGNATGGTAQIYGSASDTYAPGSTTAGGLSDIAFQLIGISYTGTTTPVVIPPPTGVAINHAVGGNIITAPNYVAGGIPEGIGIQHSLLNSLPAGDYYAVVFFQGLIGCPTNNYEINAFVPGAYWGYGTLPNPYAKAYSTSAGGCMQQFHIDPTRGDPWEWGALSNTGTSSAIGDSNNVPAFAICYEAASCDTIAPAVSTTTLDSTVPNVLLLPGIEGSRLYEGANKLWEPDFNSNDVPTLYSDQNGNPVHGDIYTKEGDIIDSIPLQGDVYGKFKNDLEVLRQQGKISGWKAIAYDWRLPIDQILTQGHDIDGNIYYAGPNAATDTPYIIQELRHLTSNGHKVTIVAHSNGGLVAKRLTQLLGDQEAARLIDKIILVASPQAGTPYAAAVALHGNDQDLVFGLLLNKNQARTFGSTTPMLYDLLPSASYFTQVDNPVVTFDPSLTTWASRYGSVIHSQETMDTFLTDSYGRVDALTGDINQPIQLDAGHTLVNIGNQLHSNIDNWAPPSGIKVYQIAGWGIPSTLAGINYISKNGGVEPIPTTVVDGDGVVPTPSALWIPTGQNVENFWVNIKQFNADNWLQQTFGAFPRNHGTIFDLPTTRKIVGDIASNSFTATSSYQYLTNSAPVSTDARLKYTLRSPLTLDFYDNLGRHTGISTTTGMVEEQIPNSYFLEVGDVKTIFTDTTLPIHAYMRGYATDTFSVSAQQYIGDALTASTTFANIPTTASTTAQFTTTADIDTISPLTVDENGDGKNDYSLLPRLNATVTIPKDTVPPEASFTIDPTQGRVNVTRLDDESGTSSPAVLPADISSYRVSDNAGNTLDAKLGRDIQKTGQINVFLSGLSYNASTTLPVSGIIRYYATNLGTKPFILLAQIKSGSTDILVFYTVLTNKTLVIAATPLDDVSDLSTIATSLTIKAHPIIKQVTGLVIPSLVTVQGQLRVLY